MVDIQCKAETLAMKGLFLNHMDRKEEAHDFILNPVNWIGWHVYGLLHRSDKNYGEALKCYTRALKFDKDNMQILQDYSLLQIQMRNYEAFNESRIHLLSLRQSNQRNWIGLAISYHLLENYETAEKVLKSYEDTLKEHSLTRFEHSETLLYHNFIIEESGNFEAALVHLDFIKNKVCDRRLWKEKRAQFLLKLDKLQEAVEAYEDLINDNPDCYAYFEGILDSKGLNNKDPTLEQRNEILDLFKELAIKYPKSNAIKYFPLNYAIDVTFRTMIDEYMQIAIRKGVPSLFVNLKKLYTDPQKEKIIEELIEEYYQNLMNHGVFTQSGTTASDIREPPTAYLWTLYLLAQHYNYKRDVVKALKFINEAIDHTPTLVELYMTKGRILKHGGDISEAMKVMNEARELDLQDRFINSKCAKYMLRVDQTDEAEKTIGLFTRGDALDPLTDLIDMQCMWFALEEGESYMRRNKLGKALKRFHQIEKHFADITDDQFDFHTYCLRKVTLRAYFSILRLEDQLRSHPYYFCSAQNAIKIYLKLYDSPNIASSTNMTEGEIKKAKNKAKKAAIKAQQEAETKKALAKEEQSKKKIEKPQDDDPEGVKFLKTENPLGEAFKFLIPLQELSQKRIETHLLAFEIYIRKVSNNTKINETTTKVIEAEKSRILPDNSVSLIQFNNEFLKKNKGSIGHLLAGVESLLIINPEKKQEAEDLLFKVYEDEYLNDRTLKNCILVYEAFKNTFESPKAKEFKKKCQEWFPISTYFKDS
ncbi:14066_t:CDS:10 [Entrophospora sp. SA101]|nr:14066_t:CDS:10 [Entrophospora sp. SA101]CAJ0828642.1 3585_t:CDS:10 [Entrophospora sp. SA101]